MRGSFFTRCCGKVMEIHILMSPTQCKVSTCKRELKFVKLQMLVGFCHVTSISICFPERRNESSLGELCTFPHTPLIPN